MTRTTWLLIGAGVVLVAGVPLMRRGAGPKTPPEESAFAIH